jgi:pimeloyl-ACP methyl ester carboxylesterase
MALVTVNARADGLDCDDAALAAALEVLPPDAPVVVMIHGYRFMPGQPGHCPHEHILSLHPTPGVRRAISWPDQLGLSGKEAGLAVAFGWPSRGSLRDCYARAALAGAQLAALIARLRALAPDRPVDVIAHSLGARVALAALPRLDAGDLGRVILLAAAELRGVATAAMDTPAGRSVEVLNVTTEENTVFDLMLRTALTGGLGRTLGRGLARPLPNWTDLPIDDDATLAALAARGYPLDPPGRRVCHWSVYLRPGVFPLYRAILTRRIGLVTLRAALPPAGEARKSRLRTALRLPAAPFLQPDQPT